jgi:hypothetical protein
MFVRSLFAFRVMLAPAAWVLTQILIYPGENTVGHRIPLLMPKPASQPTSIQHQPAMISPPNPTLTSASGDPMAAMKLKSSANEQKIPRPANAFILYRKDKHVPTVAKHPDLHNNEICKSDAFLFALRVLTRYSCHYWTHVGRGDGRSQALLQGFG